MSLKAVLLIALASSGAAQAQSTGTGYTCGAQCNGDLICSIENIGSQVYCAAAGEFHSVAGGATNDLYGVLLSVSLASPTFDQTDADFYQQIVYTAETVLMVFLLFNGIKLMYSSVLSATERAQAKHEAQQTLVNMALVGLSMPLYMLALDVTSALATSVSPTPVQFNSAIFATLVSSSFFAVLLLAALAIASIFWIIRFTIAFIGLFLLPFALAFESFWVTASIGRGLKLLIASNMVVQVLQALFLKLLVLVVASNNSFIIGSSDSLMLAVGVLAFGTWVTAKLYANAFNFHPVDIAGRTVIAYSTGYAFNQLAANNNQNKPASRTPSPMTVGGQEI